MKTEVKICGLSEAATLDAAVQAGASHVGFVFFPASPRHVPPVRACELAARVPAGIKKVGLFVDADDAYIEDILAKVPLDMLQFHGDETPDRVVEVRAKFRVQVMKAIAIAGPDDVARAHVYEAVADQLLFDARAPEGADRPGGNAQAFDWTLIAGEPWARPWMLAGGLTAENVADAVRATGAQMVDVSSGVEDRPGHKDASLIRAFIEAVKKVG